MKTKITSKWLKNKIDTEPDMYNDVSESALNNLLCDGCNGTGVILQDDGSDSTGTFIDCELCNDDLLLFHECPSCNFRCNCGSSPCECDCSKDN